MSPVWVSAKRLVKGSRVLWQDNRWYTVRDVRRHALSDQDHTVWVILDDFKFPCSDQPKVHEDYMFVVDQQFS